MQKFLYVLIILYFSYCPFLVGSFQTILRSTALPCCQVLDAVAPIHICFQSAGVLPLYTQVFLLLRFIFLISLLHDSLSQFCVFCDLLSLDLSRYKLLPSVKLCNFSPLVLADLVGVGSVIIKIRKHSSITVI